MKYWPVICKIINIQIMIFIKGDINAFLSFEGTCEVCKELLMLVEIAGVSQTFLGNPQGPIKPGNPNTSTEVKLCLFFYLFRLKK